jgi:hypothetical protein
MHIMLALTTSYADNFFFLMTSYAHNFDSDDKLCT